MWFLVPLSALLFLFAHEWLTQAHYLEARSERIIFRATAYLAMVLAIVIIV